MKQTKSEKWLARFNEWLAVCMKHSDNLSAFEYEQGFADALIASRAPEVRMLETARGKEFNGVTDGITLALTYRQLKMHWKVTL